jgi:hypothetical protein
MLYGKDATGDRGKAIGWLGRLDRQKNRTNCRSLGHAENTPLPCYTDYVSRNLTLTIDEGLLRSARKVALDRDTSVNQLVRDFLVALVEQAGQRRAALAGLDEVFQSTAVDVGPRAWTRDQLHDRSL